MSDPVEQIETATNKFPFGVLLIGNFLQGALFLMLDGPILFVFAKTHEMPRSLLDAYRKALSEAGTLISHSEKEILLTTAFLVLCLVLAQILKPVAQVAGIVMEVFLKIRRHQGFSSRNFAADSSADYLARLMRDPLAKAHWEWELFLFYQRRSAAVTFVIWIILLGWMRYTHWGTHFNLAYALETFLAVLLFLGVLLNFWEGSKGMRRTHDLYLDLPKLPHKQGFPVPSSSNAQQGATADVHAAASRKHKRH